MRKRDYHKKKAIKYDSESQWELYKTLRNEVNINMRKAKSISTFVIKSRQALKWETVKADGLG